MKIDRHELTLRMLEAAVGMKRPKGHDALEALGHAPANLRGAYERATTAAIQYFIECAGPIMIVGVERQDPTRETVDPQRVPPRLD